MRDTGRPERLSPAMRRNVHTFASPYSIGTPTQRVLQDKGARVTWIESGLLTDNGNQMTDLLIHLRWGRDRVSHLLAQEFPVALAQAMHGHFERAFA